MIAFFSSFVETVTVTEYAPREMVVQGMFEF